MSPESLIYPAGEIRPAEQFPERTAEQLTGDIAVWLAERAGEDGVDEEACKLWAYHRAFAATATRLAAAKASMSVPGAVSVSTGSHSVTYFSKLADEYLDRFEVRVASNLAGPSESRGRSVSRAVPVRVVW